MAAPLVTIADAIGLGAVEPPATDLYRATERWSWIADLYDDSTWGLTTAVPGFPQTAAAQIADACRATAAATSSVAQWLSIDALAAAGLTTALTRPLALAWEAAVETATDGLDHLAGQAFGGAEAVAAAFGAVLAHHPAPIAAKFIDASLDAWSLRTLAGVRSVA